METRLWWRRVRQHFGISAPRMAVRTHLPWWGRGAILAGRWSPSSPGCGGGASTSARSSAASTARKSRRGSSTLEAEAAKLRIEATDLRARNSTLESELGMTRGAQQALSKQVTELSGRERAAQGRTRRSCRSSSPTRASRRACRSSAWPSSATTTTCGTTTCSSSAAAARRTNSKATWSCRSRWRPSPGRAGNPRDDAHAARRPAGDQAGAWTQIQVLSESLKADFAFPPGCA